MGSPCGTIMLSPSTAPRWKRQTKTGRQQAAWGGKGLYEVNAARARNSGSKPTLNRASPPDFTKTLLVIDMFRSSDGCRLLPPLPPFIAVETPVRQSRGRLRGHELGSDRACPPTHVCGSAWSLRT